MFFAFECRLGFERARIDQRSLSKRRCGLRFAWMRVLWGAASGVGGGFSLADVIGHIFDYCHIPIPETNPYREFCSHPIWTSASYIYIYIKGAYNGQASNRISTLIFIIVATRCLLRRPRRHRRLHSHP